MPSPTVETRHKLNRDPITDPHLVLLEFQEDGNANIVRACVNTEDYVWGGNTYTRAAIEVTLMQSGSGEVRAKLTASNVDRQLSRVLDSARRRISTRLILIDTGNDTTPMIDTSNLMIIPSATGTAEKVTVELGPRADLQEPVPFQAVTRQHFPGVYIA